MNPVQIGQVRGALKERFDGLVDMSDYKCPTEEAREDAFLSRGLPALAVQIQQPCGASEAARAVFDGRDDHGLDAIAVDMQGDSARITLVQAKWSRKGMASFGEAEVLKLCEGLDMILDREFDRFNSRFQNHAKVLEQALDSPMDPRAPAAQLPPRSQCLPPAGFHAALARPVGGLALMPKAASLVNPADGTQHHGHDSAQRS